MCEGRPEPVRWREGRSWLLASDVRWENAGTNNEDLDVSQAKSLNYADDVISVRAFGYPRCHPWCAHVSQSVDTHTKFWGFSG